MTVKQTGRHLTRNGTIVPLGAAATFTGVWEDVSKWDTVTFACKADVSCTIYADFTSDPTFATTDSTLTYDVSANINEVHRLSVTRPFYRIRILNGATEQTYLSVSTMVGSHPQLAAPMNLNLGLDSDAIVVRPTLVSDEIVIGRRPGVSHFNKFGYRTGLTASAGEQTIWDTTGNFVPMTTASTFTIAYTPASDGSTSTGAHTIYFAYIDADGLKQIGLHTLGSSGSDVTSFSGLGINRCAVSVCGSNNTNGATISITETTGGTTQAVVPAGQGTTQQCIFFTDSNSDAVAKYMKINTNKLSGGGSPRVTVKGYVFNRQFEIQFEIFRITIDTGSENTVTISDTVGFALSPTDVLYFVADSDTNNATVNLRFSLVEYKRD